MSFSPSGQSSLIQRLKDVNYILKKERPHCRVLSIQSHVVSGYVGNKCAVFPLQLLGFQVDSINSVQLSNHTQYEKGARGQKLNSTDLEDIFQGLCDNELERKYSHILTGYCGEPTFLKKLGLIVNHCREVRNDLLYVCDPVLGDNKHYYVPREMCTIYKNEILPLADIITPNAFELGELSGGIPVETESDCLEAIRKLHIDLPNLRSVICTSLPIKLEKELLACYASERIYSDKSTQLSLRFYRFEMTKIDTIFTGTGDLFSALFLAWWEETERHLCDTLRATIASMQAVLRRTAEVSKHSGKGERSVSERELQLIDSRMDLLQPKLDNIIFKEIIY
ncbi:Phos_pyr_kin domain-containing protein [Meloidogyne graminicola]|uniref:Pyridoxal kinase n=1 Tax=Meloidogyne graminicola TaxID=189291 RepID=A0A8S9ZTJ9_9BILA|nr:Phos_pyr_kin domain-containing protein [Meloidogyne graminicola]